MTTEPSILILDDDHALAHSLQRAFERRGIRSWVALDIPSALELTKAHSPSRGVIDLRLHGNSGLEAIAALKALRPDMELVVLTGYASIATAVEAIKLGARHYLPKPAHAQDILKAFEKIEPDTQVAIAEPLPTLKVLEWEAIHEVLVACEFNISEAARRLGMHRRTLARKLEKRQLK